MMQRISPAIEQLVEEKMATGRYASADELLLEAFQALDDQDEELRAIQEGIDSVDRGDEGVPVDEAFERLRNSHKLPG